MIQFVCMFHTKVYLFLNINLINIDYSLLYSGNNFYVFVTYNECLSLGCIKHHMIYKANVVTLSFVAIILPVKNKDV